MEGSSAQLRNIITDFRAFNYKKKELIKNLTPMFLLGNEKNYVKKQKVAKRGISM